MTENEDAPLVALAWMWLDLSSHVDLGRLAAVCTNLRTVASDERVWATLASKR